MAYDKRPQTLSFRKEIRLQGKKLPKPALGPRRPARAACAINCKLRFSALDYRESSLAFRCGRDRRDGLRCQRSVDQVANRPHAISGA